MARNTQHLSTHAHVLSQRRLLCSRAQHALKKKMADVPKRACYSRKAKEKICERLYSDEKGTFKNNRVRNRPCLPDLYEVERVISARGTGEVFKLIFNI